MRIERNGYTEIPTTVVMWELGAFVSASRGYQLLSLSHMYSDEYEKTLQALRYCHSQLLEDTPKMVVDCRFLSQHSSCGRTLVFKQLSMLVAHNRARPCPWPVAYSHYPFIRNAYCSLRSIWRTLTKPILPLGY